MFWRRNINRQIKNESWFDLINITILFLGLFQWFGNMVTMEWWDDIWLNEGLATFMQYLGLQAFNKNWTFVILSLTVVKHKFSKFLLSNKSMKSNVYQMFSNNMTIKLTLSLVTKYAFPLNCKNNSFLVKRYQQYK